MDTSTKEYQLALKMEDHVTQIRELILKTKPEEFNNAKPAIENVLNSLNQVSKDLYDSVSYVKEVEVISDLITVEEIKEEVKIPEDEKPKELSLAEKFAALKVAKEESVKPEEVKPEGTW